MDFDIPVAFMDTVFLSFIFHVILTQNSLQVPRLLFFCDVLQFTPHSLLTGFPRENPGH